MIILKFISTCIIKFGMGNATQTNENDKKCMNGKNEILLSFVFGVYIFLLSLICKIRKKPLDVMQDHRL